MNRYNETFESVKTTGMWDVGSHMCLGNTLEQLSLSERDFSIVIDCACFIVREKEKDGFKQIEKEEKAAAVAMPKPTNMPVAQAEEKRSL